MSLQFTSLIISKTLSQTFNSNVIDDEFVQVTSSEAYNSDSRVVLSLYSNVFSQSSSETGRDGRQRVNVFTLVILSELFEGGNLFRFSLVSHKNESSLLLTEDSVSSILIEISNERISVVFQESLHLFSSENFVISQELVSFIK